MLNLCLAEIVVSRIRLGAVPTGSLICSRDFTCLVERAGQRAAHRQGAGLRCLWASDRDFLSANSYHGHLNSREYLSTKKRRIRSTQTFNHAGAGVVCTQQPRNCPLTLNFSFSSFKTPRMNMNHPLTVELLAHLRKGHSRFGKTHSMRGCRFQ